MSYLCPNCNSFPLEGGLRVVGFSWEEALQLVVRNLWRKYDWIAPNKLLVVQTGDSASQAKVFKARAVPQGVCVCENFIVALKLLANQQKGGDSPVQIIVKGHCEKIRKGTMEGLRNFIEVDNHSALEVGYLKGGTRSFCGTKAECPRGEARVSIREGPEELTLRRIDGVPPLVDADWHEFRQAIYKCVEGRDWEQL